MFERKTMIRISAFILFYVIILNNIVHSETIKPWWSQEITECDIEASKINTDWYLWMHHTVNEVPKLKENKYLWQKEHSENLTGTSKSYKPAKISKSNKAKKYDTWKN